MKVRSARFGRVAFAAAGALLIIAPVALWAQSDQDRRRAVGNWLVEDVADQEDGIRRVHVRREEGDYSIDYHMWLRAGPTVIESHGFAVDRLNCARGMEETTEGEDATPADPAAVRARLVAYLEECEAPAAEVAALLEGYERAFALARTWADERLAENAYTPADDEMAMDMNMSEDAMDMGVTDANATDMGMDMDMNMDMTTDMNATVMENAAIDPQ